MPYIGQGKTTPTVVFSGALPASGAYGASTPMLCGDFAYCTLYAQYTTGSALGAYSFYVETSPDGTTYYKDTVKDLPVSSSSGSYNSWLGTDITKVAPVGNCNYAYTFSTYGAKTVRFQFAEYGVTGSAGSLVATVVNKHDD